MGTFAEVGFKGTRRECFTATDLDLRLGGHVIVGVERGEDLGEVLALGQVAERKCASSSKCTTSVPTQQIESAAATAI